MAGTVSEPEIPPPVALVFTPETFSKLLAEAAFAPFAPNLPCLAPSKTFFKFVTSAISLTLPKLTLSAFPFGALLSVNNVLVSLDCIILSTFERGFKAPPNTLLARTPSFTASFLLLISIGVPFMIPSSLLEPGLPASAPPVARVAPSLDLMICSNTLPRSRGLLFSTVVL